MKPFHIETERLLIRDLLLEDLEDFLIYRSNPEVTKYQGFDGMNREDATDFIIDNQSKSFGKPGEWVQYAIINIERNKLVGDCAIRLDLHEPRIAETGITISHVEQKKGYATEVMLGLLHFLFIKNGIHRIVETVDAENEASIRLLEGLGFRREGLFIKNVFFKGKWGSECQYAMLREEWMAFQSALSSPARKM